MHDWKVLQGHRYLLHLENEREISATGRVEDYTRFFPLIPGIPTAMFKQLLLSLFLFLVCASGLQSQTHAWNTALDGNWNNPVNWNTGTVPNGAGDFPSITATGAPYVVTMNIDVLMDGFNFVADSATLNLTGRTITMNAAGQVGPATNDVMNISSSSWLGLGTLRNDSLIAARGTVVFEHLLQEDTLRILGDSSVGNAHTTFNNTTINNGTIELSSVGAGYASTLTVASGQLTNTGTLEVQTGAGGIRTFNGWLRNNGQVTIGHPTTMNTGPIQQQSGVVHVTGTNLLTLGNGTDFQHEGGSLTIDGDFLQSGATFSMSGGNVHGTARLRNGTLSISDPSAGTFKMEGTNTLLGDLSVGQLVRVIGDGSVGNGLLNITNAHTNNGRFELSSVGGGFASNITMGAGSVFTNQGIVDILVGSAGLRTLNGEFINDTGGNVSVQQPAAFNVGPITNRSSWTVSPSALLTFGTNTDFTQSNGVFDVQGDLTHTGGSNQFDGGSMTGTPNFIAGSIGFGPGFTTPFTPRVFGNSTLTSDIPAATSMDLLASASFGNTVLTSAADRTINGVLSMSSEGAGFASIFDGTGFTLTNQGTLETLVGSSGLRTFKGSLENLGNVNLQQPTTFSAGTVRNSNSWSIAPGATMTMQTGQTFEQVAGSFDTGGGFTHTSGTDIFTSGTLLGEPRLIHSALSIDPSNFTGPATLLLEGNGTLNSSVPAATQLTLSATGSVGNQNLTATGDTTLAGTTIMNSVGAGFATALTAAPGFTITNSGTLRTEPGAGGLKNLNGNLTNTGAMELNTNTNFNSGTLTNDGNLGIASGQTLQIAAAAPFIQQSGSIANLGTFSHLGGTNLFVSGKTKGTLTLKSSTTTFDPAFTQPVNLLLQSTTTFVGSTVPGQDLIAEANGSVGNTVVTMNAGFQNGGDLHLTSVGAGFASILTVNGGAFQNSGLLESLAGAGGIRTVNGQLDNSGVVSVVGNTTGFANGTFTNMAGGAVRGDGTLNLVSGGTLQNDGAIRPGNEGIGTLSITGNLTQGTDGFLVAELGGLLPDTEHDVLSISGTANLDGEVRVRSANGFVPVFGNQFVILTAGSINGTFRKARLVGSELPLGLKFDLVYTATTVTAQVVNEFGVISPEATPISVSDPVPGLAGQNNTFQIDGLGGFNSTQLVFGLGLGTSVIAGCPVDFGIASATSVGTAASGITGTALVTGMVPASAIGTTGFFQALDVEECQLSDVVTFLFP